jgi:hypothetical protein
MQTLFIDVATINAIRSKSTIDSRIATQRIIDYAADGSEPLSTTAVLGETVGDNGSTLGAVEHNGSTWECGSTF